MHEQLRLTEETLVDWLRGAGLLAPGESARVEPAGDGNINWVRRVRIEPGHRSLIVKQARPALERFPEYQTSTDRIVFEHRYGTVVDAIGAARGTTGGPNLSRMLPRVLHFDQRERVLAMEDIGDVLRLDAALAEGADLSAAGAALGRFLGEVHAATAGDTTLAARFANDEMRRLHGEHIFVLPLRPNEFPLMPAMRARAEALWKHDALIAVADAAYARYLEPRGALVHGDVQAGNVLLGPTGPRLLDAEIAHVGDPAFDLGVLLAHLAAWPIARGALAAAASCLRATWNAYTIAWSERTDMPALGADAIRYAGLELLRRTLGAARIPATATESGSQRVLDVALRWISEGMAFDQAL
jgi:5-methylthioribose kinase